MSIICYFGGGKKNMGQETLGEKNLLAKKWEKHPSLCFNEFNIHFHDDLFCLTSADREGEAITERERDIHKVLFLFVGSLSYTIWMCALFPTFFFHLVCIWHSRPQAWISWGKINRGPPHLTEVVITIIMICTNPATGLIRSVKCSRGSQSASQLVW